MVHARPFVKLFVYQSIRKRHCFAFSCFGDMAVFILCPSRGLSAGAAPQKVFRSDGGPGQKKDFEQKVFGAELFFRVHGSDGGPTEWGGPGGSPRQSFDCFFVSFCFIQHLQINVLNDCLLGYTVF